MRKLRPLGTPEAFASGWVLLALLITVAHRLTVLARPFHWLEGDLTLMGRVFLTEGVWALRGIPAINNPPLSLLHDLYAHWPPLLPILLSWWYRLFPVSEAATRSFMLLVHLVTAVLLYRLAVLALGRLGALITLLMWLGLPVVIHYSPSPAHQNLVLVFILGGLIAYLHAVESPGSRKWLMGACVLFALAALSSWEAVLAAAGLLVHAWLSRDAGRKRLASRVFSVTTATAAGILGWYTWQQPQTFLSTCQTLLYRANLASTPYLSAEATPADTSLGTRSLIWALYDNHMHMLGVAYLVAGFVVFVTMMKRRDGASETCCAAFFSLFAVWVAWVLLLPNHVATQAHELLMAAPVLALSASYCVTLALDALGNYHTGKQLSPRLLIILAPAILLYPIAAAANREVQVCPQPTALFGFLSPKPWVMRPSPPEEIGKLLAESTPRGAVVISTVAGGELRYYSNRHVEYFTREPEALTSFIEQIHRRFPATPLYLAVGEERLTEFQPILRQYQVTTESPGLAVVVALDEPIAADSDPYASATPAGTLR